MGFSNQERINLNSKVLAAGVKDANEVSQWYESFFSNKFVLTGDKVWTDPDVSTLLNNPAANLAAAQAAAAGPLSSILEDLSDFSNAVRLTSVAGTNGSTYVAYSIFNDPSSDRVENWLQPQLVPQINGLPSTGYSVRLFEGDPNGGGTEVLTTDGTTGTGSSTSVGWVFDYANGMLLLSSDFRGTITDPYIVGFRYVGSTADGYSDGYSTVLASNVIYSNTTSLLQSTNVQDAIDELDGYIDALSSGVAIMSDSDGDTTITLEQPLGVDTDEIVFTTDGYEVANIITGRLTVNNTIKGFPDTIGIPLTLEGGDSSAAFTPGADLFLRGGEGAGFGGGVGNVIVNQGNFGINITNPTLPLEVLSGTPQTSPWTGGLPISVVSSFWNSSSSISSIVIGSTNPSIGNSRVNFGDTDSLNSGQIDYSHQFNRMDFHTDGYVAPAISITDTQQLLVGTTAPTTNDSLYVEGDTYLDGKLTVTGLIDPTGLVLTEQAADPAATGIGEGTFWVRNDTETSPMFTSSVGADYTLNDALGIKYDNSISILTSTNVQGAIDELDGYIDSLSTNSFIQDGNSFGITATLGTNDANDLVFETSATERIRIDATGNVTFQGTVDIAGDTFVQGNLIVDGYTVSIDSEIVNVADNHLYLNAGNTASSETGGLVVNIGPGSSFPVAAPGFVAGVAGVSNPTVEISGFAFVTPGQFFQVSDAADEFNNGLFEIVGVAGTTVTIRGIGTTATVEDFVQTQFATDTTVQGNVTPVNISVIRAGSTGIWESGTGTAAPLSFSDLASDAWVLGNNLNGSEQSIGTRDAFDFVIDTNNLEAARFSSTNQELTITADTINTPIGIAIGNSTTIGVGSENIVLGSSATGTSSRAIAIGRLSAATGGLGSEAIAIGSGALATNASNSISIGRGASVTSSGGVAVGDSSSVSNIQGVGLGTLAIASGDRGIALGAFVTASAESSIAIGRGAIADQVESVALGRDANTDAANQFMIGAPARNLNTFINGNLEVTGDSTVSGNSEVTGDLTVLGDGYINGKLTVNGLIDPTGLILTSQTVSPTFPNVPLTGVGSIAAGAITGTVDVDVSVITGTVSGGSTTLTGTVTTGVTPLTGTVEIGTGALTGTVSVPAASQSVTGVGTLFLSEFSLGDFIEIAGEIRQVGPISSDTSLLIATPHTAGAAGVIATRRFDSPNVIGTGTLFTTELSPGDLIVFNSQFKIVNTITSDTILDVTSNVDASDSGSGFIATLRLASTAVTGIGTLFTTELSVSDVIRLNEENVTVLSITDNTNLVLTSAHAATADNVPYELIGGSIEIVGSGTLFLSELAVGDFLETNGATLAIASITNDTLLSLVTPHPSVFTGSVGTKHDNNGTGTLFTTETTVGDQIFLDGSFHTISAINNDTNLEIATFTTNAVVGAVANVNSVTMTGVGTLFTTELIIGQTFRINGEDLVVATIGSDTSLTTTLAHTVGATNDVIFVFAAGSGASEGTIWVQDSAPTELFYTDSDGTDFLLAGTSSANIRSINGDSGSATADQPNDTFNIVGGEGINTIASGKTITINTTTTVEDLATTLGAGNTSGGNDIIISNADAITTTAEQSNNLNLNTGTHSFGTSGNIVIESGDGYTKSGDVSLSSFDSTISGLINIHSGDSDGTGNSGNIDISTGLASGTGNAGDINITTGNSSGGLDGTLTLASNNQIVLNGNNNGVLIGGNGPLKFDGSVEIEGTTSSIITFSPEIGSSLHIDFDDSVAARMARLSVSTNNFSFRSSTGVNFGNFSLTGGDWNMLASDGNLGSGRDILIRPGSGDATFNGGNLSLNGGLAGAGGNTGDVNINGITYPGTDGSNGQVITTDGSGNLSFSTASGSSLGTNFIFQPGGTASGNIYTSWAALYADLITTNGIRNVLFDNDFSAITIPAGVYDLERVILRGKVEDVFSHVTVTFADGATVQNLYRVQDTLDLTSVSTSSIITIASGTSVFVISDGSSIIGGGTAPFVDVQSGATLIIALDLSGTLTNNTIEAVNINAGASSFVQMLDASNVGNDSVAGAGTITFVHNAPNSSLGTQSGFSGTLNVTIDSSANLVSYNNATSSLTAVDVQAAIDEVVVDNNLAETLSTGNTTGGTDIVITGGSDITGTVLINGIQYPAADGTSGQGIITNGSGVFSFADIGNNMHPLQFTAMDNEPDAIAPATLTTIGDRPALTFSNGSVSNATFSGFIPNSYLGNGLTVTFVWTATGAGNCQWNIAFERVSAGSSVIANSFAASLSGLATAGAANTANYRGVSFTNAQIDGLVAGESFRVRIDRAGGEVTDTLTSSAEIISVTIEGQ